MQLPLRGTGHRTGFGDAETPTNAAQPQQAGTNNTRTAPQASTIPSSFLLHGSGGEKVQRQLRPRTRGPARAAPPEPPGLTPGPGPAPGHHGTGRNASGSPEGPSAGPGSGGGGKHELRRSRRRRPPETAAGAARPRLALPAAPQVLGAGGCQPHGSETKGTAARRGSAAPARHTGMPPTAGGAVGRAQPPAAAGERRR